MKLKDSKMNQRLLAYFMCIILYCGCTQSEVVTGDTYGKGKEVSACLRLNILSSTITQTRSMSFTTKGTTETDSVSVTPGNDVTKSTTDPGETADKTIQNLWAGQYNGAGELVAEEYFSSLPTQESVNLPLKRIEGTSHVWVVANAGNLLGKVSTETALKSLTTSDAFTGEGLPVSNLCIMTGMWSGTTTENISADIQLKRSVAKIKFTYSVGGENFSFTPSTLELCHVPVQMKYIGDETPVQLSGDEDFKTYAVASPGNSGTHCWYIPENPAGTGSNVDGVATNKTGEGVTHATCIRLTGEAVQDGVTYGDVVFTLYPGNGNNDYNIVRNGLYTIDIKLTGIDFSDKRVTVGTVPEMQDPENLGAEKGATGIFQVTTRPGLSWSFVIPSWLSAVVGDQTYESGTRLDFIGPYKVNFETTTANPRAEIRETSFTVGEKQITVKQNPSSLAAGSSIELSAEGNSVGSSTFKATKGLPWSASLSSEWGSWLAWNGQVPVSGADATGEDETLAVKAAFSNPSSSNRTGTILLKGGDAISDAGYIDLTGSISVTQAGATISVTDPSSNPGPEASSKLSDSFVATCDLPWVATVTNGTEWLSLLSPQNGTTGAGSQTLNYATSLNLNASERKGAITIRVGNEAGDSHPGPSANITVTQKGSVFDVVPVTLELESKAGSGTVTISGTKDLPWTVVRSSGSEEISVASPSEGVLSAGSQTLTFNASENTGSARSATFTVAVTGGDHSKTVRVKQESARELLVINQSLADAYKQWVQTGVSKNYSLTTHPPFKYDGGNYTGNSGTDRPGTSSSACTISKPYTIEVEDTQKQELVTYYGGAAVNYCKTLGDEWRVPTMIELFAMWQTCKGSNNDACDDEAASTKLGAKFLEGWYWSSSVLGMGQSDWLAKRAGMYMKDGQFSYVFGDANTTPYAIRCVRDINN